ncbi:MAG TPA: deoxyribodipyrimidine photo-lyase [Candidatus Hydrogenedens sp.]|nr:deoxyribodipyrimidine photo-lyase [Candidatus Hydrogenedens sp.]
MNKKHSLGLFIFRRDLRIDDNSSLIYAARICQQILPCFIFDPQQVENNPYRGDFAVQFMVESLLDLQAELIKNGGKLYLFYGKPEEVLSKIFEQTHFDALFINRDYTPFSKKRDNNINNFCKNQNITFYSLNDALLTQPEDTLNNNKTPITVFSRFYKKAMTLPVSKSQKVTDIQYYREHILGEIQELKTLPFLPDKNEKARLKGGRKEGLKILKRACNLQDYKNHRDIIEKEANTFLSPYLKFGCLSPREVFHTIKNNNPDPEPILRQLYWRDFFTTIAFYFPYVFGNAFNKSFQDVWWSKDENTFHLWSEGMTGFPIVDAGMRELKTTGWMHNRARLIVGSFLTKDLHMSWLWGEKYFATKLIDYDPSVNNGNWQWVAGTGCDAQPYFRIFNPWLQSKRFDPDTIYIKKWIPELKNVPSAHIHQWDIFHKDYREIDYPAPIVNHHEEAEQSKILFKRARLNLKSN